MTLARRIAAEAVGTAFLLAAVVGSGIMGERLAGGIVAVALLANTLATGAMLVTLILTFGPISGAHFNPAVTLADASQGGLPWREVPGYIAAQLAGAFAGVASAHLMFGEAVFSASRHVRAGGAQLFSEFICDLRPSLRDLGLCTVEVFCCALRRRRVHHRGLLVHGLNILCQSRRDVSPLGKQYLRRHPARRCAGIHCGATCGRDCGNDAVPLAGPVTAERCYRRRGLSSCPTEE